MPAPYGFDVEERTRPMAGQTVSDEEEAMSDINVVPLTDVMLVLLIVFLITTQVIKQAVPITLAQGSLRTDGDQAGKRVAFRSQRSRRQLRNLLGHDQDDAEGSARPGGAEAGEADQGRRRRRKRHRGKHARSAHPRRHQHQVQVHRRGDHHHAAGWVPARWLHFRAAAAGRLPRRIRSNSPCPCRPPAKMPPASP